MARTFPVSPSRDTTDGEPRRHEWGLVDLFVLPAMTVLLFVVVFMAALGQPPFGGTTVVTVLGFAFVFLTNLTLGALASGAVIEIRHGDWSRLGRADDVFVCVALIVVAAVDAVAAWWVFTSDAGGSVRWIFLGIALVALAGGVLWAWPGLLFRSLRETADGRSSRGLWPQHAPGDHEPWRLFTPLTGLLGATLGVVVAIAYLGISAWHENQDVPAGHPLPAALTGINGGYVALGDSYSAGEGLVPFAPGTAATNCDRSVNDAYPDLLVKLLRRQDPQASFSFTACSGALISQILNPTHRGGGLVPAQISGKAQPSVRLVTLTIGGNNAIFSKVVATCLESGNCMNQVFPPPGVSEATAKRIPPGPLYAQWAPATIEQIGDQDAALFRTLRQDFPQARIVVIGYPYLFPTRSAPGFPFFPPECASILSRLSATERGDLRTLQDDLNSRTYEEAAVSGIEFVSPVAIWDGHEPCGASGQYTNSVKPYLNFPNPINGGSFHPNAAGQQTLASLLACYLDANPRPPDAFTPGAPHLRAVPELLTPPAQLHMVPPPGQDSVPGSGTIPGCSS